MATIFDRPLSGVTDVLGLTRYHHLAEQMKETIDLYELTLRHGDLCDSSDKLKSLINEQTIRLCELDTKAGWLPAFSLTIIRLLAAAYLLVITIALLESHYSGPLAYSGAALGSLTFVIYIGAALDAMIRQIKTERKRVSS